METRARRCRAKARTTPTPTRRRKECSKKPRDSASVRAPMRAQTARAAASAATEITACTSGDASPYCPKTSGRTGAIARNLSATAVDRAGAARPVRAAATTAPSCKRASMRRA